MTLSRSSALLLGLVLGVTTARAEPDPEAEAIRAYQAKDHAGFLRAMQAVHARDPARPRSIYNLASAEALGGSPDAAIALLRQLAATGLVFAIDRDDDFRGLAARADFQAVVKTMQRNRAPRGRASVAFTLREPELLVEGVAHDPQTGAWFAGSVRHRKIVAIERDGRQRDFVPEGRDEIGGVFGLAVDRTRRLLWASTAAVPQMIGYRAEDAQVSGLAVYELATGKQIASYAVPRDKRAHVLGDVIVSRSGDAYATDSAAPTIYRVTGGKLEVVLEGPFRSLQGLALSSDERTLYVADYALGVFAVDLATRTPTRLAVAPGIAVTGIDGLYLHRGRLIATQNGVEPRRVIALGLDPAGTRIVSQQILLSGDPRTNDLSLGAIVGDALYFNAASGWAHYNDDGTANQDPAAPHAILKLALPR